MGHDGAKMGHDSAKMGHDSATMGILCYLGFHRFCARLGGSEEVSEASWGAGLDDVGSRVVFFRMFFGNVGSKMLFFWLSWGMLWYFGAKMAHKSAKTRQDSRT